MDVYLLLNSLAVVVVCAVAAYLHFRNARHHRHQQARRLYRLFVGFVCLAVAVIYLFNIVGLLPTPLPAVIGRNIVTILGLCLLVVGWVEY